MVWARRLEMIGSKRAGKRERLRIWVPLAALLSSGCSAIVDTDSDQCASTSDCLSKGGAFSTSICSPEKVCVPLQTEDCLYLAPEGAPIKDDTLVFGFMGPLVGEYASNGIPQWEGVQLALDEFNKGANGLPLPDGTTRSVVVIGCHDFDDHIGVAKHLVHGVGVPAILGPAFSGITLDVATEVAVPGNTLLFASSATSPAITNLADKGLVWRTCPSDALQAIPLARLVSDMETLIRAEPTFAGGDIRVAMAVKGDAYGTGLADAVMPLLVFNGQSAAQNGANFTRKDYPDPADDPDFDFLSLVSDIIKFEPHIVLPIGTNETVTKIMLEIEARLPGSVTPPIYLFADGGRLDELIAATNSNAALRKRVLGTAPGRQTEKYKEWASRFQALLGHQPLTYADTAYDSAYLLGYSVVSLGSGAVTGPALAEGLKKTVGGTPVVPGTGTLGGAFSTLLAGGTLDYDGVSGPLDFDVDTGEAPADIDIWCIQPGGGAFVSSNQYYGAESAAVVGSRTTCEPELNSQ